MHGTLIDEGSRWRLRFERRLSQPPEQVWPALTEEVALSGWYPTTIEGERKVGAPLQLVFAADSGPPLTGKVVDFEPQRVFAFDEGDNRLRFELSADKAGSALVFQHDFAKGGSVARVATGWHVCLDLLQAQVAGEEVTWNRQDRWEELYPAYVERFIERDAT